MLLDFIQTLQQAKLEATPREIAEALLLACFWSGAEAKAEAPARVDETASPTTNPNLTASAAPPAPPLPEMQPAETVPPKLQAGDAVLPSSGGQGTAAAVPFRSPRARALPGALKIAGALRPLRKRHHSSRRVEMDEEATVQQIADGGPRTIVWRPRPERWLSVELVLDESLSMHVWRPTLSELRRLLEQHGAFNGVNVWQLNADDQAPRLWQTRGGQRQLTSAAKVLNPNRRQLVIVVSDCTAQAWHHGGAYQWLVDWARRAPLVLAQVLPRALWLDTSMIETDVLLSSTQAGVANPALRVAPGKDGENYSDWLRQGAPLPVVTLDEWSIAPWAKMVAGVSQQQVAGFVLPDMTEMLGEALPTVKHSEPESAPDSAETRVKAFATASPLARELARLLAAVPLSLPVMQLVQQARLPQSRQSHLAEIFRSDLLAENVVRAGSPHHKAPFNDEEIFDFHEGVRDELLRELSERQKQNEAVAVLEAVENFIATRTGQSGVFSGLIVVPDETSHPDAVKVDELALAFARIGAHTLRKLNLKLEKAEKWDIFVQHYKDQPPAPSSHKLHDPAQSQPKEIYAFTHKDRNEIQLPLGATIIDFAYAIHTDVGNQCSGAVVNGRIVPLQYQIQNGDTIDIHTMPRQQPSRDWLRFTATSRARREIKQWLKKQQREEAIEKGKKLLGKEAQRLRLKVNTVLEDDRLKDVMSNRGFSKLEDLYAALGYGQLTASTVLRQFVTQESLKKSERNKPSRLQQINQSQKKSYNLGNDHVIIEGVDDVLVTRARCCNPIRGEEVFGFVTLGKGVVVHAKSCPNASNLMVKRERILEVTWLGDEKKSSIYSVPLSVTTEDRQGMLAALINAIANMKTNISDTRTTIFDDASARIDITVGIIDVAHLNRVLSTLKSVEGVISVERA